MTTGCPGYATFIPIFTEDTNDGRVFIPRMKKAWEKYGGMIQQAVAGTGFPLPFFMGILCAESLGSENACGPCNEKDCPALYPNCMPCCAYGIMQITDGTARSYGGTSGQSLMGNPELSFKVATNLFVSLVKKYGLELPKIAGAYNSGSFPGKAGCVSGRSNMFGNSENSGYTQRVVTFANTFVALGLDAGASGGTGTWDSSTMAGLAMIAGSAAALWYFTRKH
jgi:hypothetical protein